MAKASAKPVKEPENPPQEPLKVPAGQKAGYLNALTEQIGTVWNSHAYVLVADPPELEAVTQVVLGKIYCVTRQACGACPPCRLVAERAHPSVRMVEPSEEFKKPSIRVKQIRELQETLAVPDLMAGDMSVLILPADMMEEESSNALLKTLEEPPRYVKFFLVTARPSLLLQTILSRCQVVRFPTNGLSAASPEAVAKAGQLAAMLDRVTWDTFDEVLAVLTQTRGEWDRAFASDVAEALLQTYRRRWRAGESSAVRMIPHVEWIRSQLVKNMNVVLCLEQFCIKAMEERLGLPKGS